MTFQMRPEPEHIALIRQGFTVFGCYSFTETAMIAETNLKEKGYDTATRLTKNANYLVYKRKTEAVQ